MNFRSVPRHAPGWRKRALAVREHGRWRTARGPAPRRTGTAVAGALAACAAVCAAVIATVMAGRDGLARPSPAGHIWPWRTGPAGS